MVHIAHRQYKWIAETRISTPFRHVRGYLHGANIKPFGSEDENGIATGSCDTRSKQYGRHRHLGVQFWSAEPMTGPAVACPSETTGYRPNVADLIRQRNPCIMLPVWHFYCEQRSQSLNLE
jgi:hypothetical protein